VVHLYLFILLSLAFFKLNRKGTSQGAGNFDAFESGMIQRRGSPLRTWSQCDLELPGRFHESSVPGELKLWQVTGTIHKL